VTVSLAQSARAVEVCVADDGLGVPESSATLGRDGFGLYRLRERIEVLGGKFVISSEAGKGFRASFSVPMKTQVHEG
jgi:signal transduction histidine kinase